MVQDGGVKVADVVGGSEPGVGVVAQAEDFALANKVSKRLTWHGDIAVDFDGCKGFGHRGVGECELQRLRPAPAWTRNPAATPSPHWWLPVWATSHGGCGSLRRGQLTAAVDVNLEWLYLLDVATDTVVVYEATCHNRWLLHSRHPLGSIDGGLFAPYHPPEDGSLRCTDSVTGTNWEGRRVTAFNASTAVL